MRDVLVHVTLLSVIKGRLPHIISLSLPPSPIAMGTAESSRKSEGPHGSGRKLLGRCVRHGNRSLIGLPTKQIGLARKVPQHRNAHLLHRCGNGKKPSSGIQKGAQRVERRSRMLKPGAGRTFLVLGFSKRTTPLKVSFLVVAALSIPLRQ